MKLLSFESREEIKEVDFGIVEAGTTKTLKVILKNDTNAELTNIKMFANDSEVKIDEFPKLLIPRGEGIIVVSYSPDVDIKKGLKTTLNISGQELYRA